MPESWPIQKSVLIFCYIFQSDVQEYVSQLERIVPNYLLRFSEPDLTEDSGPLANSHSDYGSSISSTETALANALNDSFIMVN